MQARRVTWWAAVPLLALLGVVLAACAGSNEDKAGGTEKAEPRVLTLANGIGARCSLS